MPPFRAYLFSPHLNYQHITHTATQMDIYGHFSIFHPTNFRLNYQNITHITA